MTSPFTSLNGAVVVVTGGTQGLGEAVARTLAERGAGRPSPAISPARAAAPNS